MSFNVIGIGEVLWDLLPAGPRPGGAPANFAHHARQLGADAKVISRVGPDELGRKIVKHFEEMGIGGDTLQVDERIPTGTAKVELSAAGVPRFNLGGETAWDFIAFTEAVEKRVVSAHAICFGSLAQRNAVSGSTIARALAAAPSDALRVFDINLRAPFYTPEVIAQSLAAANILKLNEDELAILKGIYGLGGNCREQVAQLSDKFALKVVALTRGENGSLLYRAGNCSEVPGARVEVADTVGAGDAFTAGLVMGLLNRLPLEGIHRIATNVASFVCSCHGATPALPESLKSSFLQTKK